MFTVAPSGNTKLLTAGLTFTFCSTHSMVTGSVAEELEVEKASIRASFMALIKPKKGNLAPKRRMVPYVTTR